MEFFLNCFWKAELSESGIVKKATWYAAHSVESSASIIESLKRALFEKRSIF